MMRKLDDSRKVESQHRPVHSTLKIRLSDAFACVGSTFSVLKALKILIFDLHSCSFKMRSADSLSAGRKVSHLLAFTKMVERKDAFFWRPGLVAASPTKRTTRAHTVEACFTLQRSSGPHPEARQPVADFQVNSRRYTR